MGERFTSCGFSKPNGSEAELLQFRSRFLRLGSRAVLELECPDSDGSELYRCLRQRSVRGTQDGVCSRRCLV